MTSRAALVVALMVGLGLTGCSSTPGPPPVLEVAPADPASQTWDWARRACGVVGPVYDVLGTRPDVGPAASAVRRTAYLDYLSTGEATMRQALDGIGPLGPAPVEDVQQAAEDLRGQLANLREDLSQGRAELERADPADLLAVDRAVSAATDGLGVLGNDAHLLGILDLYPQLDEAVAQTPECDRLTEPTAITPAG